MTEQFAPLTPGLVAVTADGAHRPVIGVVYSIDDVTCAPVLVTLNPDTGAVIVDFARTVSRVILTGAWEYPQDARRDMPSSTVFAAITDRQTADVLAKLHQRLAEDGPRRGSDQFGWFSRGRQKRVKEARSLGVEQGVVERDSDTGLWYALDADGQRIVPEGALT